MNCLSFLTCLVITQASHVKAPSQREVNGFFLGQYKPVLTAHFGKPFEIRKTDDGWEQRIYILNRSQGSYMIFEFVPAAPDTIYAIQITGPSGTTMFPFAGLKLGDPRTRVDAVLGAPAETKELGDIPGYIAYYEDRNYSVEFQPDDTLSSIRIVGYVGFNADPTAIKPDLTLFKQAIFRRELLWPHHRPQAASYDRVYRQFSSDEQWLPSKVLEEIAVMGAQRWVSWRACQHGDLHLGNISLDESAGSVQAFLIDSGWMEPDACGKDLASLELALVLHQHVSESSIAAKVHHLFGGPVNEEPLENDALRNTAALLVLLRERALKETDLPVYSLLLLDQALMQLGSLVHGVTANKIASPVDAVELYRLIAAWYFTEILQHQG